MGEFLKALFKYGLPILLYFLKNRSQKDKRKQKKIDRIEKETKDAIKERDAKKLTKIFGDINR